MKRFNNKSRGEQLFVLCLLFILFLGIMCVSGCGGSSCETPKCARTKVEQTSGIGISIPGCGGCITPGKGCCGGCALWPSSCKAVRYSGESMNEETGVKNESSVTACDVRYYGGSCFGCNSKQKSCYAGCINIKGETSMDGFVFGTNDENEKLFSCSNGCQGCISSGGLGATYIYMIESMLGVE